MEEHSSQNGWFFIRFVTFTSNIVLNIIWNQSMVKVKIKDIEENKKIQEGCCI